MAWLRAPWRSPWLRLHRWLGLGLGPLFVLLGLSGSLLVFYTGLDGLLEPALRRTAPDAPIRSWQAVLDALHKAHPTRTQGWRIELPPEGQGVVTARYLKPAETTGEFFAPLLVSVDPAQGEVLTSRLWGRFAATWLFDLHYTLLAGETGRWLVGAIGLAMLLSLLAGLLLWWPRSGHWRSALRWQRDASAARRHYDLHKLAGLLSALLLTVLAATGSALALPSLVEPLAARLGTPLPMPVVQRPRAPGQALMSLDALLQVAHQHWPEARPRWVDTPGPDSAVLRLRLALPGDPSQRFPRNFLWLDARTGEVLAQRDARQQSAGDALLAWLHPLHNGEALGLAGRVLVCVSGLLPLLLAVSGWLRWRDRRWACSPTARAHRP